MEDKGLEALLKKHPCASEILQKVQYPVRRISIKPITDDIREGTGFSYNSGYNYWSSTIKMDDIYVEFFDIWRDERDRDTEITFYVPEVQPC